MDQTGKRLTRRAFMKGLLAAGAVLGPLCPHSPFAQDPSELQIQGLLKEPEADFIFGRVQYRGGDWNTDMLYEGLKGGSDVNLLKRVLRETSIKTQAKETVIPIGSPLLLTAPFLYMTGHGTILTGETEIDNMRKALEGGAFLFGDSCNGRGDGFNMSFVSFIQRVFPGKKMRPLEMSHPLFNSYYKIDKILGGDKLVDDYIEGLEIDGRLAVVFTVNDLGCAWEGHACDPGGEEQRDHAFKMGINMIVYAMTH